MSEAMVERKTEGRGPVAKMSVEVRLLSVACLCFITAHWMVEEHSLDHGFRTMAEVFRIVALLAFIAGQWIGLRARRSQCR